MKVVVILINYNGINDTIECINSIKNQSIECGIIVVDNASKDEEALEISNKFPDIKVIASDKNLGFAGGNNLAINIAINEGYEYVLLLNNDTVLDKNLLKNLLNVASSECIAVPAMYYFNATEKLWYGGEHLSKITGRIRRIKNESNSEIYVNCAPCCCMLIHRDIIKKIGLLNESFFMYWEDTDYCIRAELANVKIRYIPSAKLWHKVSSSSGGEKSELSVYYFSRNILNSIKGEQAYFKFTAYWFTLFTRYMRMIQCRVKKNPMWQTYKKAIRDHKKGITGKVDSYH